MYPSEKKNEHTYKLLITMKKLILSIVMVLGIVTITQSQSSLASTSTEDAPTTPTQVAQDDYSEVKVSDLPQAVKDAVAKDLEDTIITQAFANKKGVFKLVVTTTNKEAKTLFINRKGEWIKEK